MQSYQISSRTPILKVLDNSEHLRDNLTDLFPALLRLDELTKNRKISVILISSIIWTKFLPHKSNLHLWNSNAPHWILNLDVKAFILMVAQNTKHKNMFKACSVMHLKGQTIQAPNSSCRTASSISEEELSSITFRATKEGKEMSQLIKPSEECSDLVEEMKEFLSYTNKQANRLQQTPRELTDPRAAVSQLDKYWTPAISHYFGSVERFIYLLWRTNTGKNVMSDLIGTGELNQIIVRQCQDLIKESTKKWSEQVQSDVYDQLALYDLKGTRASDSHYSKVHSLYYLEDKDSAKARADERALNIRSGDHENLRRISKKIHPTSNPQLVKRLIYLVINTYSSGFMVTWSSRNFHNILTEEESSLESSASSYIKMSSGSYYLGSDLKKIYVSSYRHHLTQQHFINLQNLSPIINAWNKTNDKSIKMHKWIGLMSNNTELWGFADAPFVASVLYKTAINPSSHRLPLALNDVMIPRTVPLERAKAELKSKAIGYWSEKHKNLNVLPPLNVMAEKLYNNDAFLVGNIFYISPTNQSQDLPAPNSSTSSASNPPSSTPSSNAPDLADSYSKTPYVGRRLEVSQALTQQTVRAAKNNLFQNFSIGNHIKLKYGLWLDGATLLKHSVLIVLLFFIYDLVEFTSDKKKWCDRIRLIPVYLSVRPETIESVNSVYSWLTESIRQVKDLVWRGITFSYSFLLLAGDHNILRKSIGSSCGGHQRCECCGADWRNPDELWSFRYLFHQATVNSKNIKSVIERWIRDPQNPGIGLKSIPPIIASSLENLRKIDFGEPEWKWLESFLLSIDGLQIKGHESSLLERIRAILHWDEALFLELLAIEIPQNRLLKLELLQNLLYHR